MDRLLCPLCGERELSLEYAGVKDRLGFAAGSFDFYACFRCGSISVQPRPMEEDLPGFYPETYAVRREDSEHFTSRIMRHVEWHGLFSPVYRHGAQSVMNLTNLRSGRLLEVGCSSGFQLREFARRGEFEVEGLDIDASAILHAREILGLEARCGTLTHARYPSGSFDLVVLFNVLEHMIDPVSETEEVRRILKPGGWLAIKTHMRESLQGRLFGRSWQAIQDVPRHVQIPTREGVRLLLDKAGLALADSNGGSLLENAVSVALSVVPEATSRYAYDPAHRHLGLIRRLVGLTMGLASLGFVFIERNLGLSGTQVYLARKPATHRANKG